MKVGKDPTDVAYDSANGDLYIINADANTISVISGSTNKVVGSAIGVGKDPLSETLDLATKELFVVNEGSDSLSAISTTSNTVTKTLTVTSVPDYALLNPHTGNLYVEGVGSTTVSMVNPSTNAITPISVCSSKGTPIGLFYDNATNDVVTTCPGIDSISVINAATNAVTTLKLTQGTHPEFGAYDPKNKDLYVVDTGGLANPKNTTANVTVLSSSNKITATVTVQGTEALIATYDPANGDMYVVGDTFKLSGSKFTYGSTFLSAISSSNKVAATITVGPGGTFATYDPANKDLYIPSMTDNSTDVISSSSNKVIATLTTKGDPIGVLYDPANTDTVAIGTGGSKTATLLTIYSSSDALVTTLTLGKGLGGSMYDGANGDWYFTDSASDEVSVIH